LTKTKNYVIIQLITIKGVNKSMQIFTCKKYPEFSIVAYSYENSHNWGHKAELLLNNYNTLANTKIVYINRTWERYQYQSVILNVLRNYMDYLINDYIDDYKNAHSIVRLKKSQREELTNQAKQTEIYNKLNTFYGEL
jgi:hypothetical protein